MLNREFKLQKMQKFLHRVENIKLKFFKFIFFPVFLFLSFKSTYTDAQVIMHEIFNDITQLPASGWVETNLSSPIGTAGYFQGLQSIFPSYSGSPASYLAVNFNSVSGNNTISNWKITPQMSLKNGDVVKFWTRTATNSTFPDRLQLRLNVLGTTNVGSTVNSVGNFTVLLLDINPTLTVSGYPQLWTEYTATITGVSNLTTCRLAFRYFVTNGGPNGINSNYIGIDEFMVYRPVAPYACANGTGCQIPDHITAYYSSTNSGFIISEQFVPSTIGPITSVCWFGAYFNPVLGVDCSPGPGDIFRITYFRDNFGQPGDTLAGPFTVTASKNLTGNLILGFISEFGYGATHPPVTVISNQLYWISIMNDIQTGDCRWGWVTSAQGDSTHFLNGSVTQTDDLSFCLNVPIKPDGGLSHAPVNDVCQNAIVLNYGAIVQSLTVNATNQDPPVYCATQVDTAPGLWYRFTGNGQKTVLSTCSQETDFNTKLAVYSGTCGNLMCISGNDDAGLSCAINSQHSEVVFCTTTGVSYYVYITGNNQNSGSFELSLDSVMSSPPEFLLCPADIVKNCDPGTCSAFVAVPVPVSGIHYSDDCFAEIYNSYTTTNNASGYYPVGTTVVQWLARDAQNQYDTCFQTITVQDNEPPQIQCPQAVSIPAGQGLCSASSVNLGIPAVMDNCSVLNYTNNGPSVFTIGTTNVVWTVFDIYNNSSTCVQTVQVIDNQPPEITCPSGMTAYTDQGVCYATITNLGIPVTSDNCMVANTINNAPAIFNIDTTNVLWTVYDLSNNISTCVQKIVVVDSINPEISCPNDVIVSSDPGVCFASAASFGTPVVTDNCMIAGVSNNAAFPMMYGLNEVTWAVSDQAGNQAECIQNVQVVDNEQPVIICPPDIIAETDPGSNFATGVLLGNLTYSDNCGIFSVLNNATEPYPLGTNLITWTVTDIDGNSADCIQTLTVTPFVGISGNDMNQDFLYNFPNPFHDETQIMFSLNTASFVTLRVSDISGKIVGNIIFESFLNAGIYSFLFTKTEFQLKPGVYFLQLETEDGQIVSKMLVN